MSNTYIPIDVQEYIENFYCLKGKNYNFRVLSSEHEKFKINKCKVHRYNNLCACGIHDGNDKVYAITTLIASTILTKITTMHFKTKKSLINGEITDIHNVVIRFWYHNMLMLHDHCESIRYWSDWPSGQG